MVAADNASAHDLTSTETEIPEADTSLSSKDTEIVASSPPAQTKVKKGPKEKLSKFAYKTKNKLKRKPSSCKSRDGKQAASTLSSDEEKDDKRKNQQ